MNIETEYNSNLDQQKPQPESELWRKNFVRLRQQLRQILYEKGVMSNPAVEDQWIINELRKLLNIEDSPHRFLNFYE